MTNVAETAGATGAPATDFSKVVSVLQSGTVIDRAAMMRLAPDQLLEFIREGYAQRENVSIVTDFTTFFNKTTLADAIRQGDVDNAALIFEQRTGERPTKYQLDVIEQFKITREQLQEAYASFKPPLPPYEFAKVPDGWNVETKLAMTTRGVRRFNSEYSIGWKTIESLWNLASVAWASKTSPGHLMSVRASGYDKYARIIANGDIEIGCQTVRRYELEQLALYKGWNFPSEVKEN